MIGSPWFLAPEIVKGKKYTNSVDMWALGVIIYNLATFSFPFLGDDENEIYRNIKEQDVYEDIPEHYSKDLRNTIRSLLIKDPDYR